MECGRKGRRARQCASMTNARVRRSARARALALALALALAHAWLARPARATAPERESSSTLVMRTADARARAKDTYLYTYVNVPKGEHYVVQFDAKATSSIVHHMLVYGCVGRAKEGLDKVIGGMFTSGARVETCENGPSSALLFGWGKDAAPTHMPNDVGFRVGDGAFAALVLEVHYLDAQSASSEGTSGVDVRIADGRPKLSASVLAWASYFTLAPKKESEEVKTPCVYDKSRTLRAFSFRVHTHERGKKVWLDRLVGGDPSNTMRLMARDPLLPQEFVELAPNDAFTIQSGDVLSVTCEFNTMNETTPVEAGFGAAHEMCNMYVMVYSDEPQYMSCLGSNTGKITAFEIAAGDAPTPVKDLATVRAYDVPKSWPPLGGVGGIQATNDGAYVWMFQRGSNVWKEGEEPETTMKTVGSNAVVRLDLYTGKIDKSFGANTFVMPHGLRIAPDGSIWLTDTAMHQVFHYTSSGELVRAFGSKGVKAVGAKGFCAPADVLVFEDGSFLVADGYCNKRIARFDAQGEYVGDFDFRGLTSSVNVAHQLAYSPSRGEIALANRENATVVLFGASDGVRTQEPIDLREYGYVYGLTWMASSMEGLHGYYALCWKRDGDKSAHLVRLFWPDASSRFSKSILPTVYAWSLPNTLRTPHVIAMQSSKNGGTAEWGPGLTLHLASTDSDSTSNYRRFWFGTIDPKGRELGARPSLASKSDDASAHAGEARAPASADADEAFASSPSSLAFAFAFVLCATCVAASLHARRQTQIARAAAISSFPELDTAKIPRGGDGGDSRGSASRDVELAAISSSAPSRRPLRVVKVSND